jgi:hypothetical protein
MSYAEILRRTGALLGSGPPRIVTVPMFTPGIAAYWVGLLTEVPASVVRPLVDGLKTPVVASDDRLGELVPVDPTPFDEAVKRATTERELAPVPQAAAADGGDRQ